MTRSKLRLFRLEDVNAVRDPVQLCVTHDGSLAAMTVAEPSSDGTKFISRIWLLDGSVPEGAHTITAEGKPASLPRFSSDGRRLAYLAGEESDKMQLVVLSAPFAEPKVLTRFEHGVKSFEWLGTGRFLVLASADTPSRRKKAVEGKDDAYEVNVDEPRTRMWLVSLAGGKPRPLGPVHGHVCVASVSPDAKTVAYVASAHSTLDEIWKDSELRLLDVRSGRSRMLRRLSAPQTAMTSPVFSPDGTRLAFLDSPRKGMLFPNRVFVAALDGGKAVCIDRRAEREAGLPRWLDDETLLYVQQDGIRRTLRSAPASGGAGRDPIDRPGSISDYTVAQAAGRVFFVYSETDKPPEVYALDPGGRTQGRKLTALNRTLAGVRHSRAEVVRWTSREGWTIEGLFYPPTKRVRPPYATIVVPHGGPHGAVSSAYDGMRAQALSSRGYAVFLPNFRGSTGYGDRFLLSILRDWGAGPADDIVRGIEHLGRKRRVDLKRLVVYGGSYGGYMTAWLIGHTRMFRAAVASAPVVNNVSMWGTTDIPVFFEWSFGGHPLRKFRSYWEQSPVGALKGCTTPTLVLVGDKDERVPPNQAQELYQTVKAAGTLARLVRYPREPHGINEPPHRLDFLRRSLAWFREHLDKDSPDR
jgi:dipeptidyl aminopeptidase/acylaminoacyl peptidase